MNQGISVIICCHNSSLKLPNTLKHLAQQKVPTNISWEIIIVNNNSKDNLKEVAQNEWQKYNLTIPFRIVDEPTPGLSNAREKGISEAKNDYVLFCDDDNWLDKYYIKNAIERIKSNPDISLLSGWSDGEFEKTPPRWLKGMLPALAIGKPHPHSGYIKKPIYGAGMILNKKVLQWLKNKGFSPLLSDRKGSMLTSGGDSEICFAYLLAGKRIYFDDQLYFKHFMPENRLQKSYFFKLCLSNISPLFPLEVYSYFVRNSGGDFFSYYFKNTKDKIYYLFYFFPRIFLGKYRFYSLIQFFQNLKYLILSFIKINYIYQSFIKIKALHLKINSND